MYHHLVNTLFLLLLTSVAFSQQKIVGRVVDDSTSKPIVGASIYFNNSSIGTITDENGNYELNTGELIAGELIVSSVGYQPMALRLTIASTAKKRYTFRLQRTESVLQNVLLLPDGKRRNYLKTFESNFLGVTQTAKNCTIKNLQSIYFTANGNDANSFLAFSDEPLEIINKDLGYKIHFQLIKFSFDRTNGVSFFYGYTRYESMGDRKTWIGNRRDAYYGSSLHFFRSLIKNRLEEEHFEIYLVGLDSIKKPDGTLLKMDVATRITPRDIVLKDTSDLFYRASWPGTLIVKNLVESYTWNNEQPLNGELLQLTSYLVPNTPEVIIDNYGNLENPLSVYFSGHWGYEKAANLLPFDYNPDK